MKRNKMLSSMELIDEKFVEEAAPVKKKSRLARLGAIVAAAAIMVTSVSVWLFTPFDKNPPDVSKYSESQYYPLIQKLNELTFKTPDADNRFQLYSNVTIPTAKEESDGGVIATGGASYVETTDNQVSGVIEADLIKRSDEHIFYLRDNVLSVYPINGEQTESLSTYTVTTGDRDTFCYSVEMFLSEDCSTLYVILPCYSGYKHTTQIVSLDVTNPESVTEKERVSVSGTYISSRFTEGKLLLVTNFTVKNNPDFSDESSFVPQITAGGRVVRPTMDEILCPSNAVSSSFAVVTMLSEDMSLVGSVACLSYSYGVYASADSLYLTRSYTKYSDLSDGGKSGEAMTEITRIAYSDSGLEIMKSTAVKGTVKDQYSLDEHEGVLRVAVTTSITDYSKDFVNDYGIAETVFVGGGKPNASLYCLDKESLEVVAAVENFAPEGERLQSARFDGDTAYICTSVQLSDPVFFFDLSDLGNITYKDTGTIDGFSSSLINFGEGYLLGIGVGSSWNIVKIEIYRETASGVVSVCSKEIPRACYSTEYKSYFIDRDRGLVGLMISPQEGRPYYLLMGFDGASLVTLSETEISGNCDAARALLIDGCFYVFTDGGFKIKAMN